MAQLRPFIFSVAAVWNAEDSLWSGHCEQIPASFSAPTLDALFAKISQTALDLAPDNHPHIDRASIFIHLTALRAAAG